MNIDQALEERKLRIVSHAGKPFEVLRYEDDGEICVIKGPLKIPREDYESISCQKTAHKTLCWQPSNLSWIGWSPSAQWTDKGCKS